VRVLEVDDHGMHRCSTSSMWLFLDQFLFSDVINFRLETVIVPKRLSERGFLFMCY